MNMPVGIPFRLPPTIGVKSAPLLPGVPVEKGVLVFGSRDTHAASSAKALGRRREEVRPSTALRIGRKEVFLEIRGQDFAHLGKARGNFSIDGFELTPRNAAGRVRSSNEMAALIGGRVLQDFGLQNVVPPKLKEPIKTAVWIKNNRETVELALNLIKARLAK